MEMSMIGKVQEQLGEAGLIAVVRADGKEAAEETIHRLIDKGITAIEITYTTPGASELIEKFAGRDVFLSERERWLKANRRGKPRQRGQNLSSARVFRNHWLRRPHHCIHFLFPAY